MCFSTHAAADRSPPVELRFSLVVCLTNQGDAQRVDLCLHLFNVVERLNQVATTQRAHICRYVHCDHHAHHLNRTDDRCRVDRQMFAEIVQLAEAGNDWTSKAHVLSRR